MSCGVEVKLQATLTSSHFTSIEEASSFHSVGGWMDPRSGQDMVERRKIPTPARDWTPVSSLLTSHFFCVCVLVCKDNFISYNINSPATDNEKLSALFLDPASLRATHRYTPLSLADTFFKWRRFLPKLTVSDLVKRSAFLQDVKHTWKTSGVSVHNWRKWHSLQVGIHNYCLTLSMLRLLMVRYSFTLYFHCCLHSIGGILKMSLKYQQMAGLVSFHWKNHTTKVYSEEG